MSEYDFLLKRLKRDEKLREKVRTELSMIFFSGINLQEKKFKAKYFENFFMTYEMCFNMIHTGKKGLNINSMPLDDYRSHETIKDIAMNFDRALGDRAFGYENIFWAVLSVVYGGWHSINKNAQFSMENQLFYNLIRYLWIVFTESYLRLIMKAKLIFLQYTSITHKVANLTLCRS